MYNALKSSRIIWVKESYINIPYTISNKIRKVTNEQIPKFDSKPVDNSQSDLPFYSEKLANQKIPNQENFSWKL